MPVYSPIMVFIVNILRVLLLKKVMDFFLAADDMEDRPLKVGLGIYCLLTTVVYSSFQVSVLYEVCNCLGIAGLTLFYPDMWKKRLWIAFVLCSMDMACSLVVRFTFGSEAEFQQPAIQALLLLICITVISHISYPKERKELAFDKRQTALLLVIPAMSIVILSVLMLGSLERGYALVLCSSMLLMNISVFYLYHILLENYLHLREHDAYRQQMYAYRNQLDVIMESQNRIRALRHDMKNHILAVQALVKQNKTEEAEQYFTSMLRFMTNPQEYAATGNDTVDSLLNYKIQKAKDVLRVVETKISIPGQLRMQAFDLNVVLGNLLDNAVDAAAQTEEKELTLTLKLDRGILFLQIRNSCQGVAEGTQNMPETTKADKENHGIGLKNVRRIVEKYHGEMELVCKNGSVEADIILYDEEM